jgi:hypothetical protein
VKFKSLFCLRFSPTSEEVIVDEIDQEEKDQKRREDKAKKILRQRKRLLRAKKRKLRKTKAALATTIERMEWHRQSRANFSTLVPIDVEALKRKEVERTNAMEKKAQEADQEKGNKGEKV